jgi:hypothetical protein
MGYAALTRTSCFHLFRDGAVVVPLPRLESALISALSILGHLRTLPDRSPADALDGVPQAGEDDPLEVGYNPGDAQMRKSAFCSASCSFSVGLEEGPGEE